MKGILFLINLTLLIALPFLFVGVIGRVKSFWAGRQGPSVRQPLYDALRLLSKGEVLSIVSTFVFRGGPAVQFSALLLAGTLAPLCAGQSLMSFEGDFILFAYLLSLAKFAGLLSAMDTGSSFEGMGAVREVSFSALVEPAFFLLISSFAFLSNTLSFSSIFEAVHQSHLSSIPLLLSVMALFIMLLTEGSRVPVDDPATHLELTMIHEVMVLDNSGPDFFMIQYASALKMMLITSLMAALLIPIGLPVFSALFLYLMVLGLTACLIGTVESLMARFRMNHVPQFIFFMSTTVVVVVFFVFFLTP